MRQPERCNDLCANACGGRSVFSLRKINQQQGRDRYDESDNPCNSDAQSAIDLGCDMGDLCTGQNKTVLSRPHPDARKYLTLPFFCNLVSYGTNIVASVDRENCWVCRGLYQPVSGLNIVLKLPNLHLLDEEFRKYGKRVCFMAEYFLPDVTALTALPCRFETRILEQSELSGLYLPEWRNALCEKRKELDVLAAAAYDGGHIIGLAGCSADCRHNVANWD